MYNIENNESKIIEIVNIIKEQTGFDVSTLDENINFLTILEEVDIHEIGMMFEEKFDSDGDIGIFDKFNKQIADENFINVQTVLDLIQR